MEAGIDREPGCWVYDPSFDEETGVEKYSHCGVAEEEKDQCTKEGEKKATGGETADLVHPIASQAKTEPEMITADEKALIVREEEDWTVVEEASLSAVGN